MDYKTKKALYVQNFSIGYAGKDMMNKLKVIGLICYLHQKLNEKRPITYYELIQTINKPEIITDDMVQAFSIICEDWSYGCTSFPDFGLKVSEMVPTIKELLKDFLPF